MFGSNAFYYRTLVLYMLFCFRFWLLEVESRDFSQAKKERTDLQIRIRFVRQACNTTTPPLNKQERTACIAGKVDKMTTIFTQNDNLGPF